MRHHDERPRRGRRAFGGYHDAAKSVPNPPFRAEHIGSLLRPPALLRAREEHAAGKLDRDRLPRIEDDAIRDVVKMQEDVGPPGRHRRRIPARHLFGQLHQRRHLRRRIELTEDKGWSSPKPMVTAWRGAFRRWSTASPGRGHRTPSDFRFLKSLTTRTPKITLPGPCYIHYRAGRANISRDAYPDLDGFWSDLVEGL